jgi:hypothetical protein
MGSESLQDAILFHSKHLEIADVTGGGASIALSDFANVGASSRC